MPRINILDKSVFNRIAAGEVVEKPASVVKELVENAIDALATNITIEVKGGGITSIKVVDNGCGIHKDDYHKVFLPHATSKIATIDDLEKIGTLGFRGEALSSISSVAKVTLVSKISNEDMGYMMTINGGDCSDISPVGCVDGTNITVEDLFYNVPARAKFLRKPKQEETEITNYISRLIMANPNISIKYFVEGKLVYQSQGTGLYDAIYSVYGKTIVGNIEKYEYSSDNYKFSGYIGKPTFSKPNRTYQTLIINGRYVINQTISTAIYKAYEPFLMKSTFPFFVIHLNLPLDSVDVNVHPNKLDVKFEDSNKVFGMILNSVSDTLFNVSNIKVIDSISNNNTDDDFISEKDKINFEKLHKLSESYGSAYNDKNNEIIKEVDLSNDKDNDNIEETKVFRKRTNKELGEEIRRMRGYYNEFKDYSHEPDEEEKLKYEFKKNEESLASYIDNNSLDYRLNNDSSLLNDLAKSATFKDYSLIELMEKQATVDEIMQSLTFKTIGVIFNTYIIVESDDVIYLIDQHAGHERLLYDKFMQEQKTNIITIQDLLIPYVYDLNHQEFNYIVNNLDDLKTLGFEIELFGKSSIKVCTVPTLFNNIDVEKFIQELLHNLSEKVYYSKEDLIKDYIAKSACRAAVKANDVLSDNEIKILLNQLFMKNQTLLCPHGRPIVVEIDKSSIEKWFKRIV